VTAFTIANITIRESMRKKIIQVFVLVAIILIILSQAFAFFASPTGGSIAAGAGKAGGIASGNRVELIPSEIERKTIYTILSKPVRRSAYLAGKQLGMAGTLGVNLGLMGLVFLGLIYFKTFQIPWEIIVGVLLILVQFTMLGSIALLFSVFLSRNINAALTFFVFVIGMLGDFLPEIANLSGESGNKFIAAVVKVFHYIIPNFANFNANNPLIHPEKLAETNLYQYAFLHVIPYGILYSAVCLVIALFIFDRKEM
jgi:ABC-type transport system involved in multi-copper enzyme maturation permease subunit